MKKKIILIITAIIIVAILIVSISVIFFSKLGTIKMSDFIDNYNSLLQKNLDGNISIKYPQDNDRMGASYFIPIKDSIYLGIANDNTEGKLDLKKDKISATLLRYDKDTTEYNEINQYLFYLIKVNNNKISDNKINDLIQELRDNPDSTIKKYNLIIKHNSSEYQTDSIGRVER